MMVLDTHAWIWWISESDKLSKRAQESIQTSNFLGIPAISCWEVAMLVSKQRLELSMDVQAWINLALQRPKLKLLPLTPEISVLSTRLPGNFHGDPADRLIVATSLVCDASLISKDEKIRTWPYLDVIW